MGSFIVRRLIQGLVVLILVTIFVFVVIRLLPSDPVTIYYSQFQNALEQDKIDFFKHLYGLDRSLPEQYVAWINGIVHGDFGQSFALNETVASILAKRVPVTMHLGLVSFLIAGILGITFGVICGIRRNTWIDSALSIFANFGFTAPSFWIGIVLIFIVGFKLHWLPMNGYTSPFDDFWMSTQQAILPVICLSLAPIGILTRQTRSAMLEVVQQDYMRTAKSKGLTERVIVTRHALKNAFIPIVTILGLQIRNIVGGAVIIEMVFNLPGLGGMMVSAVLNRDYMVVQAGILIVAVTVLLINLLVDISYGWLDPRIRYS
jgi:peptide/nickel transport system permease protein